MKNNKIDNEQQLLVNKLKELNERLFNSLIIKYPTAIAVAQLQRTPPFGGAGGGLFGSLRSPTLLMVSRHSAMRFSR